MTDESSSSSVHAVFERHIDEIMSIPGVISTGIGRKSEARAGDRDCIVIFALPGTDPSSLPREIEGVAVDVRPIHEVLPSAGV